MDRHVKCPWNSCQLNHWLFARVWTTIADRSSKLSSPVRTVVNNIRHKERKEGTYPKSKVFILNWSVRLKVIKIIQIKTFIIAVQLRCASLPMLDNSINGIVNHQAACKSANDKHMRKNRTHTLRWWWLYLIVRLCLKLVKNVNGDLRSRGTMPRTFGLLLPTLLNNQLIQS